MSRELFSLVEGHGSVAVVGMGKNTGKTVTLNSIIDQARRQGVVVGLTSTGRDGEVADSVSSLPKPGIFLDQGSTLATARGSLSRGSARLELLENTGITNPLGEIVIARVRQAGSVEVSGPERTADMKAVMKSLARHCQLVLVDGALDRRAASAPALTGAAVLATGAVVAPTPRLVADATVHQVKMLTLPVASHLPDNLVRAVEDGVVAVFRDGKLLPISVVTAVDGPAEVPEKLADAHDILVLGGALTDLLLEKLVEPARKYRGLQVVIRDGTRAFLSPRVWQRFAAAGGRVEVVEKVNLVAVTVNPVDPRGRQFPPGELEQMLVVLLPELLIENPMSGGVENPRVY